MNDEVIWGECCGIDIGYCFDYTEDDDCLVLVMSEWANQIDTTFLERELLDISGWSTKPFGCWKIKK